MTTQLSRKNELHPFQIRHSHLSFKSCILLPILTGMDKKPFEFSRAAQLIDQAIRPFKKAAMFELAEDGFNSPFEQLVACMISIRT